MLDLIMPASLNVSMSAYDPGVAVAVDLQTVAPRSAPGRVDKLPGTQQCPCPSVPDLARIVVLFADTTGCG
jgi:hypothetical protein